MLTPLRSTSGHLFSGECTTAVNDAGICCWCYVTIRPSAPARSRNRAGPKLDRTKASLIYRRTKNLRAVQLLLGHTKLESTVRYLGIEVALELAEQTEV